MYYTSNKEKEKKFAQFKENLPLRSMKVDCAASYSQELSLFPLCVPQSCGRFVTDTLVTEKEARALFELAEAGFKFGLSSGSASILDLHSGALSKGDHFINIYKLENAKDILKKEGFQIYKVTFLRSWTFPSPNFGSKFLSSIQVVKSKILQAISQKFSINENHLYLTHPTFFSRLSNATPISMNDEYWHPHVDKETYESFHYTSLVYLTNFGLDFIGGRFVFIESDNRTKTTIEPKVGRVMAFTSGAENLHYVEKVESGIRFVFTSNKSSLNFILFYI